MRVQIITDAISDICTEAAEQYDIIVLPIEIIIEGDQMATSEISVEEMVEWIEKNKKVPEFIGVSGQKYTKAFEESIKQGKEIVCITAGSIAISNYDCARYASTKFPNANIQIINTNRFSGNVGLLAVMAAKMAKEGKSANEIGIACERRIEKNRQTALMDSLDFLKYAGTVPKILAAGTNLFNAKFAFAMNKDDDRDAEIIGYSMKKAVGKFCTKIYKDLHSINPKTVFLTYTLSDENYIMQVYKYTLNLNYFDDVILCRSGHFNTSFVGRNCMTVTYQMK